MLIKPKPKVSFFYEKEVALKNRSKLKKFIETVFIKEKKKLGSLNIIFCTDKALLAINQKYLNHNYRTDIITFELSSFRMPIEGEIYISVDRVKANAKSWKEPFNKELHRVIFHGVLHLCGYKDKNDKEKIQMRKKEDVYIKSYFL